uniref:Uncharacterized protein n=1 Tax=Peronospora matthiolae TaxID=2874970 RepID=A0AAV1TB27_9STRA
MELESRVDLILGNYYVETMLKGSFLCLLNHAKSKRSDQDEDSQ